MRSRCWVRATSSRCTESGELAQLGLQHGEVAAHDREIGVALGAGGLAGGSHPAGLLGRAGEQVVGPGRSGAHGLRDRSLAPTACLLLGDPLPGLLLVAGAALERVGAVLEGASPLLAGAQPEAQLGLGRARLAGQRVEAVALGGGRVGLDLALTAGRLEPLEQCGVLGLVGRERGGRIGDGLLGALDLGSCGAQGLAERPELLGDRGHPGVALVEPLEGRLDGLGPLGAGRLGGGDAEAGLLTVTGGRGHPALGILERGLQLDEARGRGAAASHGARGIDVAGASDGGEAGVRADEGESVGIGGHEGDALEHLLHRRTHRVGALDDLPRPAGTRGQRRPRAGVDAGGRLGDEQAGTAGVVDAQRVEGGGRGVEGADGQRLGGRAEGGGDGVLEAGLDRDEGGDGAEDVVGVVGGGEQGGGAVLAAKAELEGLDARGGGRASALGGSFGLLPAGELGLGSVEPLGSLLVGGVETLLALFVLGDARLEVGELALSVGCSCLTLLDGGTQASELGLAGLDARGPGPDLSAELGEALATVGRGPGGARQARGLLGVAALGGGAGEHRLLERGLGRDDLGDEGLLLLAHLGRLRPQLLGVARLAGGLGLVVLGEQAHALGRERAGRGEPLDEASDRDVVVLGAAERGARLLRGRLELPEPGRELGHRGLDLGAPRDEGRLVGDLLLQRRGELDEVVGQQPQSGVAGVGLDDGGPARGLGLPPQRPELAPDLPREVLHTGEVGLHRLQLAQRALLALAVLEDTGRLLDEAAALLGGGPEHGVELPLPDDDVHLAADAAVAQQLLHVEQPAGRAVDRVVRAAVAKHRAGDRHLGVVDRERAVGVVDRQGDLGAAERRAAGGAGEDDVLHLAAAQRLRALLPHHPRERVDDVGLARAVGADDAGDARLEAKVGRRGEGLEALQGDALDVHGRWSSFVLRAAIPVSVLAAPRRSGEVRARRARRHTVAG